MRVSKLSLLVMALTVFSLLSVQAQDNVQQDLIGVKGASSEMALKNRGFTHIKTQKTGYDIYSYWWNEGAKSCICERISDGRVQSIVKTLPFDCNKTQSGSISRNHPNNHSSHHYNNNSSYYTDAQKRSAFERGFSDGKYNKAYHNVYTESLLKTVYSDGYTAGARERREQTSYHHGSGGYVSGNYKGGYVDLSDLVGHNAKRGYAEMVDRRGFKEVHSFNHKGNNHKIMSNSTTGQCVEVVLHGDNIHDIKHSEDCGRYN